MTPSLSNHDPSARPADGFAGIPLDEDHPSEVRLRGLSHEQLADRLRWLSWYQPGTFAAVMDYMDFCDALAADSGLAIAGRDPGADPAPVCRMCGADIGIFVKFGMDWRHYREGSSLGEAEIFDPGHVPEFLWRIPRPALAGN
jgi:hypothetical protein